MQAAIHPVYAHDGNRDEHERAQVDERVQHDRRDDAARDDVERHHGDADDGGTDDAGGALVEVQRAEQHHGGGDRGDRAAARAEHEGGDGEAKRELFHDSGVDRQQRTKPQLLSVAGQQCLDVAHRHDAISVMSSRANAKPGEHDDDHGNDSRNPEMAPDAADPGPSLQLSQQRPDVRPREQQQHEREPSERQEGFPQPPPKHGLPFHRAAIAFEALVFAAVFADRAQRQQHEHGHEHDPQQRPGGGPGRVEHDAMLSRECVSFPQTCFHNDLRRWLSL